MGHGLLLQEGADRLAEGLVVLGIGGAAGDFERHGWRPLMRCCLLRMRGTGAGFVKFGRGRSVSQIRLG